MYVLLITLNDPSLDSDRVMPPIGVISLHSYSEDWGFNIDITSDPFKLSIADIRKYTHISISYSVSQSSDAYELLRQIKMIDPSIEVIICQIIEDNDILFHCFGHVKNMTSRIAKILATNGCDEIGFNVESGSQQILDTIDKQTTIKQSFDFISICNEHKIKVKVFLIAGLPGESFETLQDTNTFLFHLLTKKFRNLENKLVTNDFDFTIFYPYKGTHIGDHIVQYDLNINTEKTLEFYKGNNRESECVVSTSTLTSKQIEDIQQTLLKRWKRWIR